ncbi:MAG: hypothetical protein ACRCXX_11255 [Cetobacterium sp.]|uniref:hypothetical protein n=1 Tax=Cetobacterium sp. TaxID=2071632 RepID=UPI003F30D0DF
MKKLTILFLALSAVAFGKATIINGSNSKANTTTATFSEAAIDVKVSAVVMSPLPELLIVDDKGTQISYVDFVHEITEAGLVSENNGGILSQDVYAQYALLNNNNLNKLNANFGTSTGTLVHNEIANSTLDSTLEANPDTSITKINDKNAVKYTLKSSISGTAEAGAYAERETKLTITYNKY